MISSIVQNVTLPLNYYFNFIFFNILHKQLTSKYDSKMSNNFTAMVHAIGSTILAGRYITNKTSENYNTLTSYSSAYFLYDMLFILKYWHGRSLDYAYVYHHFASLYLMHQDPLKYYGGHILFFGELSNIPSYFVYYYQKQKNKESLVKKLKWAQFILYSGIRIPIMTKILNDAYENSKQEGGSILPFLIGAPVYLMGLIWTKKLFNKLI